MSSSRAAPSRLVAPRARRLRNPSKTRASLRLHGAAQTPHAAEHGRAAKQRSYSDDDFEKDEHDSGWTRISIKDIDMGREIGAWAWR